MKKTTALLALLGIAVGLTSCGGGGASPNATVQGFLDASKRGDQDAAMQYVETGDRDFLESLKSKGQDQKKFGPPEGMSFTIGKVNVQGDTATVSVTGTKDGKDEVQQIKLVKQGGEWKIDLIPDELKKMMEGMGEMMKGMGEAMKKGFEEAGKK